MSWADSTFDYYTWAWDDDFATDKKRQYKRGSKPPLTVSTLYRSWTDAKSMLRFHLITLHSTFGFDYKEGQTKVTLKDATLLKKGIWILKYRVDSSKDVEFSSIDDRRAEVHSWKNKVLPVSEEKWSFKKIFQELGIEVKIADPKEKARRIAILSAIVNKSSDLLQLKEWRKWQRMFVPAVKAQYGAREYKNNQEMFCNSDRDRTEVLYFDMESLILTDRSVVENYFIDWQKKSAEFCALLTQMSGLTDFVVVQLSQSEYTGTIGIIDKDKAGPFMPTSATAHQQLLGNRTILDAFGNATSAASSMYR